jgi:tetratricopeptide (TPR) repeat protein
MPLLKIFSGKTPEDHTQKGDELFEAKLWGKAKVEYERALDKLEKTSPAKPELNVALREKIRQSKEALAFEHRHNADDLMEAGYQEEARELYILALELTEDAEFKDVLEGKLREITFHLDKKAEENLPDFDFTEEDDKEIEFQEEEDDYFRALCGTLPEEVQKAYLSYGENFRAGYLALNRGDFDQAADYLSRALKENPFSDSYIPLELATAYLNLEKQVEAQHLLEVFLENHPQALPGYQLLCEIFWERKAFDQAEALLASVPSELAESVAVYLLRGETLFQAGNYNEAKEFYRHVLTTYGWNDTIARALAKTHEALNEPANARNLYREIMDQCSSCHKKIDPFIKQRYADLCFESGLYNTEILELYLSLVREVPDNAGGYYQKISQIYAAQGNDGEARRFRFFAEKSSPKNR